MSQVILCVGIEPARLKSIDDLGTDNYIIIVCKTKAKEAGMTDDYFKNTFTYVEADPIRFESVSLDIYYLLSKCNPPREKVDTLLVSDLISLAPLYKKLVIDNGPVAILMP